MNIISHLLVQEHITCLNYFKEIQNYYIKIIPNTQLLQDLIIKNYIYQNNM